MSSQSYIDVIDVATKTFVGNFCGHFSAYGAAYQLTAFKNAIDIKICRQYTLIVTQDDVGDNKRVLGPNELYLLPSEFGRTEYLTQYFSVLVLPIW